MATFEIIRQPGHVDATNNQEEGDQFVVLKGGELFHAEDYLEHIVQFTIVFMKEGDRLVMDVTL